MDYLFFDLVKNSMLPLFAIYDAGAFSIFFVVVVGMESENNVRHTDEVEKKNNSFNGPYIMNT